MLWSWKKQRCRDGVMSDFVSWCRHILVPFFFHEVTSLHPPSFHRNDFSTCSTHFFIMGQSTNHVFAPRAHHTRICARGQCPARADKPAPPPHARTCTIACYGVVQCLPVKSPTIYRRNLWQEKNDRLVSVHTSIDYGDVW